MKFDHIQPSILKGNLVLQLSNNKDASITVEAIISEERLIAMYRSEFTKLRFIPQPHGNSPYYKPTAGYISLEDWATENLNEKRGWEIWGMVTADEIEVITND